MEKKMVTSFCLINNVLQTFKNSQKLEIKIGSHLNMNCDNAITQNYTTNVPILLRNHLRFGMYLYVSMCACECV